MKLLRNIIIYGLPLWLFLVLFFFYGYGEATPLMFNKIAGLLALILIGITFLIGPLSYVFPSIFKQFKTYRRFLGVSGFLVAVLHAILSFLLHYHGNLSFMLLDPNNEDLIGVYLGLTAISIFLLMAITSTDKAVELLGFRRWKMLQTTGYLALILVMLHFIFMETDNGVFVIKKPLGRMIFVFGFLVLVARIIVFLLTLTKRKPKDEEII